MYEGYLAFSGNEILNAERTEAYVRNLSSVGLKPVFGSDRLHVANQEPPYASPMIDDAPWFSETDPSTSDFYGLYPLDITGIDDSTLGAGVTENLGDGATVDAPRDASRAVRVHGLLVGASAEAAMAGLDWLKEAVRSADCGDESSCAAGDLRYFVTEPDVEPTAFADTEPTLPTDNERYGQLDAPHQISHRWGLDELSQAMPAHVRWTGSATTEGTVLVYGSLARDSAELLDSSDPVPLWRVNYFPNPTVRSDLNLWRTAGAGVLAWSLTDGVDGASHGSVIFTDNGFGSGAFGASAFGEEPFGGNPDAGQGSLPGVATSTLDVVEAGDVTTSIALRGEDGALVVLTLTDSAGRLVTSASTTITADWDRYALTGTLATRSTLTLTIAASSGFDFDQALLERGSLQLGYFDAGDLPVEDAEITWLGTPDASASEYRWNPALEQSWPDSNRRPFLRALQGSVGNLTLDWWTRDQLTMDEQLDPYERVLHEVACTQGPHVINRFFGPGGYFIEVDLIFVAGNPHPYSIGTAISTLPIDVRAFTDPQVPDTADSAWLVDPRQPVITAPPTAPAILDPELEVYSSWARYYVAVPASAVQEWGMSVPVVSLTTGTDALDQVRVRFHPNPFQYDPSRVDPLSYCSEVILSYLPAHTRLVIDGMNQRAIASKSGQATVPADHLLYGAGGGPIDWPELSCGIPYVLTVDVPRTADSPLLLAPDTFDIELVMKRRS